jgi:hypothetical protein
MLAIRETSSKEPYPYRSFLFLFLSVLLLYDFPTTKEINMNMNISLAPLVSLIAGILILVAPRLLNYIVAIYLIVIGLIGLFGNSFHIK